MVTGTRILGIDPGERRVGLALSDELCVIAKGLDTFDTKTGGSLEDRLAELIDEQGVVEIVVGHPVSMSGRANQSSIQAEELAERLRRRFGIKVALWDERLTTVQAKRVIKGERAKKGTVDKIAAILILQNYLDFRANSAS